MPLFTFQERFVQFVREGSKRQTIRNFRKYPVRAGQFMHPYTGPRFKPVKVTDKKLIADVKCLAIFKTGKIYIIQTNWLSSEERTTIKKRGIKSCKYPYVPLNEYGSDLFAFDDGFRVDSNKTAGSHNLMMRWWKQTHDLPFVGFITYW